MTKPPGRPALARRSGPEPGAVHTHAQIARACKLVWVLRRGELMLLERPGLFTPAASASGWPSSASC